MKKLAQSVFEWRFNEPICLFLSLILQRDLGQTGKTVYRISVCLRVIFFFFFSLEYIPLTSNAVAVASVSQFSVLTERFF